MSNIIKSNYIYVTRDNKKVISYADNNVIPGISFADKDGFKNIDYTNDAYKVDAIAKNEANTIIAKEVIEEELENARNNAMSIISDAHAKAELIISQAQEKAREIETKEFEEAKNLGYSQGYDVAQRGIAQLKDTLISQQRTLNQDYDNKVSKLEKDLVGIMASLIAEITGVVVENEDVLTHMLHRAFMKIENSNKYIIKVSEQDFLNVMENKESLYINVKDGSVIEVVADSNLTKNQCIIETDVSIIDCSLDVQMKNVSTQLRLLSLE